YIAVISVSISFIIGVVLGILGGYFSGFWGCSDPYIKYTDLLLIGVFRGDEMCKAEFSSKQAS
ncbi:MAG: hypothetical protein Q8763_02920, partial [Candidatus Phytoplasma australasiaticum]|nr:hypothetical protein [Candidatus Phytoplasma australasiaticum]